MSPNIYSEDARRARNAKHIVHRKEKSRLFGVSPALNIYFAGNSRVLILVNLSAPRLPHRVIAVLLLLETIPCSTAFSFTFCYNLQSGEMGGNLSTITPSSTTAAVDSYVAELGDVQYEKR